MVKFAVVSNASCLDAGTLPAVAQHTRADEWVMLSIAGGADKVSSPAETVVVISRVSKSAQMLKR